MAGDPYARLPAPIPVTLVLDPGAALPQNAEPLIVLGAGAHSHEPGQECVACNAAGDVRAHLFDLGEQIRRGDVTMPERVIVDARQVREPQKVLDALSTRLPANGLRDHSVARNFKLDAVV